MKILLFNPNTSDIITERLENEVKHYLTSELSVDVKRASMGPQTIVSNFDEVIASYVTVNEVKKEEDKYDAFIIGCFADPGLLALREVMKAPVVGILEAALHEVCLRERRFSIMSSCGSEDIAAFHESVRKYGFESRLASVRCLNVGVEGVDESILDKMKEICRKCFIEDGATGIILGCAGFAGYGRRLTKELGFFVTDGLQASLYMAKAMAEKQASLLKQ